MGISDFTFTEKRLRNHQPSYDIPLTYGNTKNLFDEQTLLPHYMKNCLFYKNNCIPLEPVISKLLGSFISLRDYLF